MSTSWPVHCIANLADVASPEKAQYFTLSLVPSFLSWRHNRRDKLEGVLVMQGVHASFKRTAFRKERGTSFVFTSPVSQAHLPANKGVHKYFRCAFS